MYLILAVLPFLASAKAALTILYPSSDTIWYKNNTVALNWTSSAPDTDTYSFRALLSNQDTSILSGPQQIADSTNATADYVRVALPGVPAAQNYIVTFVNTTNQSQVLATSEAFEIQDGMASMSSSSSMMSSATSSQGDIPNANTVSQSQFPTSFPSSSSGAARPTTALFDLAPYVFMQGTFLVAAMLGGAAVML